MTAGRLAAAKPAATTNTTLYRCPIDKATSSVLEVCNQSASATSYRVALRDYDQILTLDSSSYALQKGNVITDYSVTISPGISVDQLDPGDAVRLTDSKASFKYHDIFKPTATITYPVKVVSLGGVNIDSTSQVGSFDIADTITGATTGLTATVYATSTNSLTINISPVSIGATTFYVSDNTGITSGDLIAFDGEVVSVNSITGYQVTVTRSQLGTTATAHNPGRAFTAIRSTATTTTINEGSTFSSSDLTLTVTSSTGFSVGDYIRIDNEVMQITSISGNDLGVSRGVLGTTAATHADLSTVTRHTTVVTGFVQLFSLTESISNGTGASVDLQILPGPQGAFESANKFVYDLGNGYEFVTSIPVDMDRVVRFTQSDSSNTGYTLRFSTTSDGTNSGGTEYTTGVTISGTAGSSGAYSQIDLSSTNIGSNTQIYIYVTSQPLIGGGGSVVIDTTPNYTTLYLYDLEGSLAPNDTFQVNNVTYTITAVSSGPYAYVQSKSGTALKVSLGKNSSVFAGTDTFYDSPLTPGSSRTLATVSSVSDISAEDYIFYDKSISGNTTDRNTGIVVGPGQSVVVYSGANTLSYVLQGFEDITTDFSPVYYIRNTAIAPQ